MVGDWFDTTSAAVVVTFGSRSCDARAVAARDDDCWEAAVSFDSDNVRSRRAGLRRLGSEGSDAAVEEAIGAVTLADLAADMGCASIVWAVRAGLVVDCTVGTWSAFSGRLVRRVRRGSGRGVWATMGRSSVGDCRGRGLELRRSGSGAGAFAVIATGGAVVVAERASVSAGCKAVSSVRFAAAGVSVTGTSVRGNKDWSVRIRLGKAGRAVLSGDA